MSDPRASVETMSKGAAAAAAGLAGSAIIGARAGYKSVDAVNMWAHPILIADMHRIAAGQPLPYIAQPSDNRRSKLALYLLIPLGCGAVLGLIGGLLFGWLLVSVSPNPSEVETAAGLIGPALGGLLLGLVAGAFGALIGYLLWKRSDLGSDRAQAARGVWIRREQLRAALAEGRISPQDAITQIQSDLGH